MACEAQRIKTELLRRVWDELGDEVISLREEVAELRRMLAEKGEE